MKKNFLIFVFLFVFIASCKQEISNISSSSIRYLNGGSQDKVKSVIKTTDGGFLFIGYTTKLNNTNGFLLKVDAKGNQQWYKDYGGKNYDLFYNAINTSDGGFLAVGSSNTESFDTAKGLFMGYVVKIDAKGNIEWENRYGDKITRFMHALENPVTKGFWVTGTIVVNYNLICLCSIDITGKQQYLRYYSTSSIGNIPPLFNKNLYNMIGNYIVLKDDGSGNLLIGGVSSKSDVSYETQNFMTHVLEVSNSGIQLKNFYRLDNSYNSSYSYIKAQLDFQRSYQTVKIIKTKDGFLLATFITGDTGLEPIQVIKTDASCNISQPVWQKMYQGLSRKEIYDSFYFESGNALLFDINDNEDGTYLLSGGTNKLYNDVSYPEGYKGLQTMIVKIDQNGGEIWKKYFGVSDNSNLGMCSQKSTNGGYVIAGYTSLNNSGFHKMFLQFIDNEGNQIKTK